jgi:hypothetical protein
MRKFSQLIWAVMLSAAVGCGDDTMNMNPDPNAGGGTDPGNMDTGGGGGGTTTGGGGGPVVPMISVSGDVVDFTSQMPLQAAQVTAAGVTPVPQVAMMGGQFLLTNVQPFSVFYLTASNAPDYLYTNEAALKVDGSDVTGVVAAAVKATDMTALSMAFKAQTTSANGTLLVQVLDASGKPQANVPAGTLMLQGITTAKGPFFLDANRKAAPMLTATSASGWAVWFDVPSGPVSLTATVGANKIDGAPAQVAPGVATLGAVVVQANTMAPPTPKNVSFATQVVPIFAKRGCVNCHSGNGPGRDIAGLTLDASVVVDYKNVAVNVSDQYDTTRVNLKDPAKSLILTMPSYENPPDPHPTVVFPSNADPDYQTILVWITEGAKNN